MMVALRVTQVRLYGSFTRLSTTIMAPATAMPRHVEVPRPEPSANFPIPGNPVSTFVLFEILVKPFLYKLMGHNHEPLNIQMPLAVPLISKKTKRQRWLPVAITNTGTVKPVEYHGSAHINSLCSANGLVSMDIGVSKIEKGSVVKIRLI